MANTSGRPGKLKSGSTFTLPARSIGAPSLAVSGDAAWVGRLSELGVRQGCRLQVLQPGSPCLLQVAGCKLCVRGDDLAQIYVHPVEA